MMRPTYVCMMAAAFGLASVPSLVLAEGEAPPEDTGGEATPAEEEASTVSINVDVEASSAYVWRGANLLGPDQNSQSFVLFPGLSAAFGPVTVGYWGAYQLTGDTKSANVDGGIGAEQDLYVGYDGAIGEDLGYSAYVTYYFYPLAEEEAAGTGVPMYVEPALGLSYSAGADLGLGLSYYLGLQDATRPISFIYVNPNVGKELPLSGSTTLSVSGGVGLKVWTNLPDGAKSDQVFDAQLGVAVNLPFSDMYVSPALHASWATFNDTDFGDEFVAWGGVNIGYDVSL